MHRPASRETASEKPPTDSGPAGDDQRDAIDAAIDAMAETPMSSVAMCHRYRKTAVYLSEDGQTIIEHAPNGDIKRIARTPALAQEP